MELVEEIFLNIISQFTPEQLTEAIQRDVSLAELICEHAPFLIAIAKPFVGIYSSQLCLLKADNMLAYLRQHRPDLAAVINGSKQNYKWLEKNIIEIKKLLVS